MWGLKLLINFFLKITDRFYNIVEKDAVIQITNGQLKAKNAQYNKTGQDYELTLGRMSEVHRLEDDDK